MKKLWSMRGSWLPLGAACCVISACQEPPFDAGPDPPNSDSGVDLDAGPEDAGGAEGEGEGECIPINAAPEYQPDDAGVIHYENCPTAEYLYGTCTDGSCATTDTQRQLVALIVEVATARGYGDRIEVSEVHDDLPEEVLAWVIVIADWVRAFRLVGADIDGDGLVLRERVEDELPLYVPSSLPSIEEIYAQLRLCAPDILVDDFCHFSVSGRPYSSNAEIGGWGGQGAPNCIGAVLNLWDPTLVDSGTSEVRCLTAEVPCCD